MSEPRSLAIVDITELMARVERLENTVRELTAASPMGTRRRPGRPQGHARFERIVAAVCDEYQIDRRRLRGAHRAAPLVRARQVVAYLARTRTNLSLLEIGKALGDFDHTTIMHSIKKIAGLRLREPALHRLLSSLEEKLAVPATKPATNGACVAIEASPLGGAAICVIS